MADDTSRSGPWSRSGPRPSPGEMEGVLADHADDIVMFDVRAPYQGVRGIRAYRDVWPSFFAWQAVGAVFEIESLDVTAGSDVAFAHALIRCGTPQDLTERPDNRLRLTLGLRKEGDRWVVAMSTTPSPTWRPGPDTCLLRSSPGGGRLDHEVVTDRVRGCDLGRVRAGPSSPGRTGALRRRYGDSSGSTTAVRRPPARSAVSAGGSVCPLQAEQVVHTVEQEDRHREFDEDGQSGGGPDGGCAQGERDVEPGVAHQQHGARQCGDHHGPVTSSAEHGRGPQGYEQQYVEADPGRAPGVTDRSRWAVSRPGRPSRGRGPARTPRAVRPCAADGVRAGRSAPGGPSMRRQWLSGRRKGGGRLTHRCTESSGWCVTTRDTRRRCVRW